MSLCLVPDRQKGCGWSRNLPLDNLNDICHLEILGGMFPLEYERCQLGAIALGGGFHMGVEATVPWEHGDTPGAGADGV